MGQGMLNSLYKDVVGALGSVAVLFAIGYYVWLPDLLSDDLLNPENSVVPNVLWKVFLHLYLPAVVYCFVVGEITGNFSQVDKIWAIIPFIFSWYITLIEANYDVWNMHPKSVLMSLLVTVWGLKLTFGFYLRGGITLRFWVGEEDYRWVYVLNGLPILKNNRILKGLFNFGFVSVYQLFLIFSFSGGVVLGSLMTRHRHKTITPSKGGVEKPLEGDGRLDLLSISDIVITVCILCVLFMQIIADVQQQQFQKEKYRRIAKKISLECPVEHYEIGFRTTGLFGYSRHPNFTCEQAIWLIFYTFTIDFQNPLKLFGVGGVCNISCFGVLLLIVLFTKSTDLTEEISKQKYPRYKDYQENVGRMLDVGKLLRRIVLCQSPNRNWITNKKC